MDNYFIKRAISLARGGLGNVTPNPLVGAVIVKNGKIIGQGYHECYKGKHAEIIALESCTEPPHGGTLYCNLEPCSKFYVGKHNPPCTNAIISSGIKRVVISQMDPNPHVSGSGIEQLESSGIEVTVGIQEKLALELNCGFNTVMKLGRPYVHIKWGQSLDGQIATSAGISKWITSEECRKNSHYHRSCCDGIIVGRITLELDNPSLDARFGNSPSPRPIIIDPHLKSSPRLKVFDRDPLILCSKDTTVLQRGSYKGSFLLFRGDSFNIKEMLQKLKDIGFNSLFIEGGQTLITQFIESEMWDRVTIYTAPILMGNGLSPVGSLGISHPKDSIRFKNSSHEIIDNHMVFDGYREEICLQG